MKKILFTIAFVLLTAGFVFAQNYSLKDRYTFKVGILTTPSESSNPLNIRIEGNYGIFPFMEAGIYAGYNRFWAFKFPEGGSALKRNGLNYGLNVNIHLLPFLVKQEDFRIDLYASAKAGRYQVFAPEGYVLGNRKTSGYDYGFYGGLAFYPLKHIGLFGEYGFGTAPELNFGLTFKF